MADLNDIIVQTTDGLSMRMDSELAQLDSVNDVTQQLKQSNLQISKVLEALEKTQ